MAEVPSHDYEQCRNAEFADVPLRYTGSPTRDVLAAAEVSLEFEAIINQDPEWRAAASERGAAYENNLELFKEHEAQRLRQLGKSVREAELFGYGSLESPAKRRLGRLAATAGERVGHKLEKLGLFLAPLYGIPQIALDQRSANRRR